MTQLAPAAIDAQLRDEWHACARGAAEANVFAEPWLAHPAMMALAGNGPAKVALVRDRCGSLIGVVPVTRARRLGRVPLRSLAGWCHANAFLAAACARAGREADMWRALLTDPAIGAGASAFQIEGLVEGGALHGGLLRAAATLGLPVAVEERVTRAMLATDRPVDAYWEASVRAKKRKELRRQWARLGETGALTIDHLAPDGDPDPWIAEFLALEASGWKGSNGSALASHADTLAYAMSAIRAGHAQRSVSITALRIDGRAIAMLITLVAGGSERAGFSFKTAFDERYARFSPGVLLQRESLALIGTHDLAFIDSCAAQDHPMIDSLWRERRSIVSLSLPLPGTANRLAWGGARAAIRCWHALKRLRPVHGPAPTAASDGDHP